MNENYYFIVANLGHTIQILADAPNYAEAQLKLEELTNNHKSSFIASGSILRLVQCPLIKEVKVL